MTRRTIIIAVVLIVLVGGGFLVLRTTSQAQQSQEPKYETVKPARTTLRSTVSATGAIQPEAQASLSFKGVGRVAEVNVSETQPVTAGQVLARLDAQDLTLAVTQAEAGLASAKANLAQLARKARAEDLDAARAAVASAEANVRSAQANLVSARESFRKVQRGVTENDKKVAAANLERAKAALAQAQAAYDQVAGLPNVGQLPQALNLQRATIDYEQAKAQYDITTAGADAAQRAQASAAVAQAEAAVASARAQLAQSKASLVKLEEGASTEQIAVAEAQVSQASAALAQARLNLSNATLISPINGAVAEINVRVGELPTAARSAIVVVDPSRHHIDINVDEIDIGQVKDGQVVTVTLEALPDVQLTGKISRISPTAESATGVVSYLVNIVLDPTKAPLRSGMSATANITTAEVNDVIVLPNRAIQRERDTNKTFVEKLVNGTSQRVEIRIGMRNDGQTQIVEGVSENDVIIVPSSTSGEQLRRTFGF